MRKRSSQSLSRIADALERLCASVEKMESSGGQDISIDLVDGYSDGVIDCDTESVTPAELDDARMDILRSVGAVYMSMNPTKDVAIDPAVDVAIDLWSERPTLVDEKTYCAKQGKWLGSIPSSSFPWVVPGELYNLEKGEYEVEVPWKYIYTEPC